MSSNTALKERSRELALAERIILQTQYATMDTLRPKALDPVASSIRPGDVTCLFRVTEIVFSREEGSLERFAIVLNAIHACGASCLLLLQCHSGRSELYIGAVNKQRYDNRYYLNTIRDIVRNSIEGNLPGTELEEIVSPREIENKLEQSLGDDFNGQCVTAISCVAGGLDESSRPENGIERLLEAIGNKNFSILVLADPVSQEQVKHIRQGYELLSSQLSMLEQTTLAVQSSQSSTVSENYAESFSRSVGTSISMTQSHTSSTGWSRGEENAEQWLGKLASVGVGLAAPPGPTRFFAMSAASSLLTPPQSSLSGSESDTVSDSRTENQQDQQGRQIGTGLSVADTTGTTITYSARDRHIKELLERVEWYLQWLNKHENYGMFSCCTYVISGSASVNLMVASQYQALIQGKQEMSQPVAINTWTRENGVEQVKDALKHMMHPVAYCREVNSSLTPAMLLSSQELSRQMALPQKSVVGVGVMEYAPFGREVIRKTPLRAGSVMRVGAVSHMGKAFPNQPVLLDMQSMTAHTFIAGTNGSGKSNTVFRLLEELMRASIPFMVIEPAKGEYKNVFGREKNVKVYGSNRAKTELLRINPFWFNEDVAVLEHIDKLIEIFNASWPMYAAMPAVLKASIESAYRACGWNLAESTCKGGCRIFPTVKDVLEEFNSKMDSTTFSQEVKGNYVGALSTRMESLCNGLYGEIFGGINLSDEELFDSNVIIDLSRVGSAETKSMIMGMLLIRLQEYRMSGEAMNLPLRHVTVLEEAHHLLRRTSMAQSDEGSNMLGKSVEMISNSIAEMRSYGEGFIIVDQSPGLLDMSVLRNTNTKMILRLPESGDRDMVGNTMGLTPAQIYELSRLKTGVCAIYQKDWLEAVLCQVDLAEHEEKLFVRPAVENPDISRRTRLVKGLLAPFLPEPEEAEAPEVLKELLLACGLPGKEKRRLLRELNGRNTPNRSVRWELACSVADLELELPESRSPASVQLWYKELITDPTLSDRWGENYLPLLLLAQLQQLANQSGDWKQVLQALPDSVRGDNCRLRADRGLALTYVCPLDGMPAPISPAQREALQEVLTRLEYAGGADHQLAELLSDFLIRGTVRRRGVLQPYSSVVWELLGGQQTWNRLFGHIEQSRYELWDSEAREILTQRVDAGFDTQTAVLSLFLQQRGGNACVSAFFKPWWRSLDRLKAELTAQGLGS